MASWFVGEPIQMTELKPKELSLEPICADSVALLQSQPVIGQAEFQTGASQSCKSRFETNLQKCLPLRI
jgi:predicted transposase YdaD